MSSQPGLLPNPASALHATTLGEDVVVAILDTGVDPGAAGLQTTPSGERKLLDLVDCTGSGDVDTSTKIVTTSPTLTGLSGRTLILPNVANPTSTWRIGLVHAFRLFPSALVRRLKKERRIKWDKEHRKALNEVRRRLAELKEKSGAQMLVEEFEARQSALLAAEKGYRDGGPVHDCVVFHDGVRWRAVVDTTCGGDLSKLPVLEEFWVNGTYAEFGGGVMLNFGINVYEDGDLLSIVVDGGSHGTHVAAIVAAGVAPAAKIVSLKIGDSRLGSMETHQGTVRALAYLLRHSLPDNTEDACERNGDSQREVKRLPRIDVVNMSFGEHSRDVNHGRFVRLVETLVYKHNVLFLSSAGNDGPALSSVSAPGGTTSAMIGVGAYVTPDMLTQAYSQLDSEYAVDQIAPQGNGRQRVMGMPYTWSSRGPVVDGAMGVSICAPGGAIASVPVWTVKKKMLMNGTSMSSPCAAGSVALVISFLKKKRIKYTSMLIRRAIENTAKQLGKIGPDDVEYFKDVVFAAGCGSVDAVAACAYIEQYAKARGAKLVKKEVVKNEAVVDHIGGKRDKRSGNETNINTVTENGPLSSADALLAPLTSDEDLALRLEEWRVKVRIEDGSLARRGSSSPGLGSLNATRGIFLRGESDTSAVHRALVSIEAVGQKEDCPEIKRAIANMEVKLTIHSTANWVDVPSSVLLLGGGRSFPVAINPLQLECGRPHFAEIIGQVRHSVTNDIVSGPIFRVPVSVHKPEPLIDGIMINPLRDIAFSPGTVLRRFYDAPVGATYAILKITTANAAFLGEDRNFAPPTEVSSTVMYSDVSSRHFSPSQEPVAVPLKDRVGESPAGTPGDSVLLRTPSKGADAVRTDESHRDNRLISERGMSRLGRGVSGSADARNFEAHIVQIVPRRHCGETESRHYMTLRPGMVKEGVVRIQGGATLELCLAQMWISPGKSLIEKIEMVFGGIAPSPQVIHAGAGAVCFPRVEVANLLPPLRVREDSAQAISGYSPRGSLTHLQRVVPPSKAKIRVLDEERDCLPEVGAISQLQLEYSFEVHETSASSVKLLFPGLNRAVYESEVEGGPYVIVHDHNNQFMFASDIYPAEHALPKGEFSAVAYLRHDNVDLLERFKDLRLTVEYELGCEASLEPFDTAHSASVGNDDRRPSKSTATLESGERRAFYLAVPKRSWLPKWAAMGDTLIGKMSVDKVLSPSGSNSRRGDIPSYEISLDVGPTGKADASKSSSTDKENKKATELDKGKDDKGNAGGDSGASPSEERKGNDEKSDSNDGGIEANPDQWFEEAVRKLRVKRLRSLLKDGKHEEFDKLHSTMKDKYPDDVEIRMLKVEQLDVQTCRELRKNAATDTFKEFARALVELCNEVINKNDPVAIATHFGMMIDPESTEEANQRKGFETKRSQLIEVLFRKARASFHLGEAVEKEEKKKARAEDEAGKDKDVSSPGGKKEPSDFERAFKELARWVSLDGKGSLPGSSSSQTMSDGSITNEDLLLLIAKREVQRERFGFALRLLNEYYGASPSKKTESVEMLQYREELLNKLKWPHIEEREQCNRLVRFPSKRTPF